MRLRFGPVVRTSDPLTSHQAAAKIPYRMSKVRWVAEYVAAHPGQTTGQVSEAAPFSGAWKRISDAKNRGLIVYGPAREYQGRNQQTCWPKE